MNACTLILIIGGALLTGLAAALLWLVLALAGTIDEEEEEDRNE